MEYSECKNGSYGAGCRGKCLCHNNATCSPLTGECHCSAGWRGQFCDRPCPDGYYGQGCKKECSCSSGKDKDVSPIYSKCNPVTGECRCGSGWTGADCRTPCPPDHWGSGCAQKCSCTNGGVCDPITGFCDCPAGFMGRGCEQG
jgi:hypothetical protein